MSALIHVDNALRILESDFDNQSITTIKNDLTIENPQWKQAELYGRRRNTRPRYIKYFTSSSGVLIMPRGYIRRLVENIRPQPFRIIDRTRFLPEADIRFTGRLHEYQENAVADIMKRRFGVLEAPPGSGKTVMTLAIISRRKQPALVIVHTKELMYQWKARAAQFLEIDPDEIGLIGDGHKKIGENITIAIINSLYKYTGETVPKISHIIVDECHHIPSRTFTDAVSKFDAAFMLGLSATPYRSDNLTEIIHFYLGEISHRISPTDLQAANRLMKATLRPRFTNFSYPFRPDDYQGMLTALAEDSERNALIAEDVREWSFSYSGIALVISDRVSHCARINEMLSSSGISSAILTGAVPAEERMKIVNDLSSGRIKVLVATAQLIGEGFDLKDMSAIFMATPVKFSGRVKQYIGRIMRVKEGKEDAFIYDYVDPPGVLQNSFRHRLNAYREMGVDTLTV